ncbi:MAG TPA: hypothetical protein VLA48_07875 [Nitrososphaeraceae archaeon]|nr:hypothetical protein [Nitrososphaeraceae archaeon]
MFWDKAVTNIAALFLGALITTSTIFSSLAIITPINSIFAEQIDNQEKTMFEKLREKYYYNNNEKVNNNNYQNNNNNNNHDTINYDTEIFAKSPKKDNKKLVCQTGQFEGFYVSYLDFCDLEISDGPNVINSAKTYSVTGTPESLGSGSRSPITSTAVCNIGDIVLEGGFSISIDHGTDIDLSSISTGPTTNGQGYFITAAGNNIVIQSNALCFNNP